MHSIRTIIQSLGIVSVIVWTSIAEAKPLRVVYLQGFRSCTNQKNEPVAEFFKAAKNNPNAKLYYGCFDGGFLEHPTNPSERFYLFTADSKGNWLQPEEIDPQSAPLAITQKLTQDLREIYPEYDHENRPANPAPKYDLFISGHSHGGWMAMRLAYLMSMRPEIELQELLTIDPVSYKLCSSIAFPKHFLSSINNLALYSTSPDCHRAPRDLEQLESYIAKATKGRWTNYYQTTMPFLSSGPISHTINNIQFEPESLTDWFTAHLAMLISPTVWADYNIRLHQVAAKR